MKKEDLEKRLDEWLMEQKYDELSVNTLKSYKNAIKKFLKYIDDTNQVDAEITKDMTMQYKGWLLEQSNSMSSKNLWITALSKYLKWLEAKDLTIKTFKQQMDFNNDKMLELTDYKRMLRYAKKLNKMKYYYIIKSLAMTGVRVGELKYFTVQNIKQGFSINVYHKGKQRTVPLRQDLRRELLAYCKENDITGGVIFKGAKEGKMPTQSTIWKNLQSIAGKAKVNQSLVHAHSFRHLFAQMFLQEYPGNHLDLADILGHSDLKTTRRYTKLSTDQQRKKTEQIKY